MPAPRRPHSGTAWVTATVVSAASKPARFNPTRLIVFGVAQWPSATVNGTMSLLAKAPAAMNE